MSGRGARGRKAIIKDIEKKEKKAAVRDKRPEAVRRTHDAFIDWRPTPSLSSRDTGVPSRSITVSSDASRNTSRSSSTNPGHTKRRLNTINSQDSLSYKAALRPKTSTSGSASIISKVSLEGKDKSRYQVNGKGSKAPRGRGGGVPIKKHVVSTPPETPSFRPETSASYVSPNQKTWINFRIWEGGEGGVRPYGGFNFVCSVQD